MTLVELLVAMIVMTILTTMIIGTWISLSKAYSFTSRSDKQRDVATQAIARMAREIRDAQAPGSTTTAFALADPKQIQFYSTFNMLLPGSDGILGTADDVTASDPTSPPRLVRFVLLDSTIYRELADSNGQFTGPNVVSSPLVRDVVNEAQRKDLFTYSAVNPTTGQMYQSSTTPTATVSIPAARIQTVRILLLVDLNPGKSPTYMDISTTVQPRNVRHL
jgi:type II secretory pathway pseudopilin PulG